MKTKNYLIYIFISIVIGGAYLFMHFQIRRAEELLNDSYITNVEKKEPEQFVGSLFSKQEVLENDLDRIQNHYVEFDDDVDEIPEGVLIENKGD